MTFADLLAADMQAILNKELFAEEAVYRAPDLTETPIIVDALPEYIELREKDGILTKMRIRHCTWDVATLPAVNLKGTIIIGDLEWSIAHQTCQDDTQIMVKLERHELAHQSRPGMGRT